MDYGLGASATDRQKATALYNQFKVPINMFSESKKTILATI